MELGEAGILALFLIFFILALQFNSVTQPFIIMVTIPFATLGVMIGLLVSNNPLTFVTLIGLLSPGRDSGERLAGPDRFYQPVSKGTSDPGSILLL